MLGVIREILNNQVKVELKIDITNQPNLVHLHVIFEDNGTKIVGEIENITKEEMLISIVGEIKNNVFTPGSSLKPSFKSNIRIINMQELELILGSNKLTDNTTHFGTSNIYSGYKINVDINGFFSNHFAILGNSGSGKSCTIASIFQNLFKNPKPPVNSHFFFFDAYGEYSNAFNQLSTINPNLDFKTYTTNLANHDTELLKIPVWLLDVDDFALLLDANNHYQLPIIEKMLSLVKILTGTTETVVKRKNDIIARAILDIMLSGMDSTKIRDQVVAILTKFNTPELSLNTQIVQPGYTRTLKQCLFIDKTGKMQEMELVVEFIRSFILDEQLEVLEEEKAKYYTLFDLENALDFALMSEGVLKSDRVFDLANVLSVRLHTLTHSKNYEYFNYPDQIDKEEYIKRLCINQKTGKNCQIVDFNINYVDDRLAKCFTKIISRMLFQKASESERRGLTAFHIVIEEAHRYVQADDDLELLGYNIFERITKEGRKYGVFLGLITQRPAELSDTCISQCSNFLAFRTLHPSDLSYIEKMIPNISLEIVLQLKNLKPGNCIAFGTAFKVPTTMYIDIANPTPLSNNVDLSNVWYINNTQTNEVNVSNNVVSEVRQVMDNLQNTNKTANNIDNTL